MDVSSADRQSTAQEFPRGDIRLFAEDFQQQMNCNPRL